MRCPHCEASESRVVETRENTTDGATRRRRECKECDERFTTYERIESPSLTVVKSDGSEEEFKRDKLKNGIERACQKRDVPQQKIEEIVDDIETGLRSSGREKIESSEIGDRVIDKLKQVDEVAYVRFASVYNSFDDVSAFEEEVETLKTNT
ncbi:MAG: transcriptional regulator NrdR [Candidatus Nanohaloarchaeota archaeon QJJ-7]|nr:transcriptional regulator NrdR [Candidatus Nanohaloarchaeota archaeon QJJ-7]